MPIDHYGNKNVVFTRLKQARLEQNLSQNQLATKMQLLSVDIDQQMISKIESNRRFVTDYEIICFAKALHVSVDYLLADYDRIVPGAEKMEG